MIDKVRHVTFSAGDWLAAFVGLKVGSFAKGVYIDVIALCYDRGEPTLPLEETIARIAAMNGDNPRTVRAAIDKLADLGKLTLFDGPNGRELEPKRVRTELERALNRIRTNREAGANGGRKSGEARRASKNVKALGEANASGETKLVSQSVSQSINQLVSQSVSTTAETAPRSPAQDRHFEDRFLEVAKIDPARWPGNFGSIRGWRNAGCTDEDILAGVEAVASRPGYSSERIGSLNYFRQAIEDARELRRAAEARGEAPPIRAADALAQRRARYGAAIEAAKAAGAKPGEPTWPKAADFGLFLGANGLEPIRDWKAPQSSQEAAA